MTKRVILMILNMSHLFKRTLVAIVVLGVIVGGGYWATHRTSAPVAAGGYQLYTKSIGNTGRLIQLTDKIYLQIQEPMSSAELKPKIQITPEVDFGVRPTSEAPNIFEITANTPLQPNTVYTIAIDAPESATPVSFALQTTAAIAMISSVPAHLATRVPINTGIELQFNRPNLGSIEGLWSIEPAVAATVETKENRVIVTPQQTLQYRTVYTFRLTRGFAAEPKADDQDALGSDIVIAFETETDPATAPGGSPAADKSYWYLYAESILPEFDQQPPTFRATVNVDALKKPWEFELYRFEPEQFEQQWKESIVFENRWSVFGLYNPKYTPPERNRISAFTASLVPDDDSETMARLVLPGSFQSGQYLLLAPKATGGKQFLWFQVTPLHTALTVSESQSVVWVRKFNQKQGVAKALVAGASGELGQTDDRGVLTFPTPKDLFYPEVALNENSASAYGSDALLRVSSGSDIAFIPVDDVRVAQQQRMYSFVSTDRKLYLPKDEINLWGVVSSPSASLADQDVTIQLVDQQFWGYEGWYSQYFGPGGSDQSQPVYAKTNARITRHNTFNGKLSIDTLKPGYYSVRVLHGDTVLVDKGIEVATFTKPSYQITVSPSVDVLFVGDEVTLDVQARFFSGEGVGPLEMEYSGNIPQRVSGRVQLDSKGNGSIRLKPQYLTGSGYNYPYYAYVSVVPVSQEEAEITASTSFTVYGPTMMLDISSEQKEKTTTFHVKALTIDLKKAPETNYVGSPVANLGIRARVVYHWTDTVVRERRFNPITKTTYPIYDYIRRTKEVGSQELTTNGAGTVDYAWSPTESQGWYQVLFDATDPSGRAIHEDRYVSGWVFGDWSSSNASAENLPAYLRVKPIIANSKDQWAPAIYRVGEPIVAAVVNEQDEPVAIAGQQILLYRVSRSGIQSVVLQETAGYQDTYAQNDVPTLEIGGVFWGPRGFQTIQPATFSLNTEDRKLGVGVQFDRAQYRPGDTATARVEVKAPDGSAKSANVELSLVDQSVYSLYNYDDNVLTETYRGFVFATQTRTSHPFELRYGFTENQLGAERGGCFGYGSRILRQGGKTTAIQDILPGDLIITRTSEQDGRLIEAVVVKNQRFRTDRLLVVNNRLRVTFNHRLLINGQWLPAGLAAIGDTVLDRSGRTVVIETLDKEFGSFDVFNLELSEPHTYFVDGIYVHNAEKGGGLAAGVVRKNFKNTAFVEVKDTDGSGQTQFSIKLPDNLTGWRARLQAASSDLFFGSAIKTITTNLPFFVRPILSDVYLAGDAPVMVVRGATASGQPSENVQYTVTSPTLKLNKKIDSGPEVNVALGALPEGEHRITIEGIANGLRDALERVITVKKSHKVAIRSSVQKVQEGALTVLGNASSSTTLTFADQTDAALLRVLQSACYADGVRLEWKLGPRVSKELLNTLFKQSCDNPVASSVNISSYVRYDGGFSVVPHGTSDLDATVGLVNVLPDPKGLFDTAAVKRYFIGLTVASGQSDIHTAIKAFYGLSALRPAILPTLEQFAARSDLTVGDQLFLAASFQNLGANDRARTIYQEKIAPLLQRESVSAWVSGDNASETLHQSALAASVAAGLGLDDSPALVEFVVNTPHEGRLDLVDFELWRTALQRARVPQRPALTESSFELVAGERLIPVRLGSGTTQQLVEITAAERSALAIKNLKGSASVFSFAELPAVTYDGARNPGLAVDRQYRLNGRSATAVGDMVDIVLTYSIDPNSEEQEYSITDYLPSGLKPTSAITFFGSSGPSDVQSLGIEDIDGQVVRLRVYNQPYNQRPGPHTIVYRARAVQQGAFRADGPNIRGVLHPDQYNFGRDDQFVIQ